MAKNYQVREVQLRNANVEENDGKMILEGYAVVFDSPTVLETDSVGNEYKEVISRNVFDDADMSDCCLKYNHGGLLLARVRGGSLKLTVDDYGLKFRAELFNTQLSRDVYEIVKQGGLDRCSFSFTVKEKKYDIESRTLTITKINKLYDVAVVDIPAYKETSVSARGLLEMEIEKSQKLDNEKLRKKLILRTYL